MRAKASNRNHSRSGGLSRLGPAEAGAAATGVLDDGERAPPGVSAEAAAAAKVMPDGVKRAPPGAAGRQLGRGRGGSDEGAR